MIGAHQRRTDKLDKERVFVTDNGADFPPGSPVALISAEIDAKMQQVLQLDANLTQALGDKAQAMEIKEDCRDAVLDDISDIVGGAIAIGDGVVPGITAKYKMPYPRTEQKIIAVAEAYYIDTEADKEKFVDIAGLESDFRENLQTDKTAFQESRDNADSATEEHAEAVGALVALFREVMALSRRRSAMVKLKYKNNPGKLAAWAVASHLEQPKKKTPAA